MYAHSITCNRNREMVRFPTQTSLSLLLILPHPNSPTSSTVNSTPPKLNHFIYCQFYPTQMPPLHLLSILPHSNFYISSTVNSTLPKLHHFIYCQFYPTLNFYTSSTVNSTPPKLLHFGCQFLRGIKIRKKTGEFNINCNKYLL